MKNEVKFSVLDTESRFNYEYSENVYSDKQIVSYGKNNDATTLFFNCYSNSATLKACIDGTVAYILGDEIKVNDEGAKWNESVNKAGMTMRQLIAQIALDYIVYGGFAIQVIYSKLGTICELYPMNFAKCRTNESGTKIFYNKKGWSKWAAKSQEFDCFNREKFAQCNYTQVLYFKGDFTKSVYPLPSWYGALNDVMTEIECSKYSLNSISNGFMARYILQFPNSGNLTDEQQEGIENAIKTKFCGSETESNFMMYFSPNTDMLQIDKIEDDSTPEKYIAIKDNARSNIFTSMRVTPMLLGLYQSTGWNTQEYSDSFKLFQKTVIQPYQDAIIEQLEKIIGKNTIEIVPFTIKFE